MQAALSEAIREEQFMVCFNKTKDTNSLQRCLNLFERSKVVSQKAFVRYVRSRKQ